MSCFTTSACSQLFIKISQDFTFTEIWQEYTIWHSKMVYLILLWQMVYYCKIYLKVKSCEIFINRWEYAEVVKQLIRMRVFGFPASISSREMDILDNMEVLYMEVQWFPVGIEHISKGNISIFVLNLFVLNFWDRFWILTISQ